MNDWIKEGVKGFIVKNEEKSDLGDLDIFKENIRPVLKGQEA